MGCRQTIEDYRSNAGQTIERISRFHKAEGQGDAMSKATPAGQGDAKAKPKAMIVHCPVPFIITVPL
jgi:hypothetical protein